jgi:hypothetical protein
VTRRSLFASLLLAAPLARLLSNIGHAQFVQRLQRKPESCGPYRGIHRVDLCERMFTVPMIPFRETHRKYLEAIRRGDWKIL